jgi:hypothetical protein
LEILEVLHAYRFNLVTFELLHELLLLEWFHFYHDVFRFEVGVDDLASFMQIDQS